MLDHRRLQVVVLGVQRHEEKLLRSLRLGQWPYPSTLPPLDYVCHFLVKRVTDANTVRYQSRLLFLANALDNYHIGLEGVDDGFWSLYFRPALQATFDERDYIIQS